MITTIFSILFILAIGIFIGIILCRPDAFQTRLDAEDNQRNFDAGVLEGRQREKEWQEIKKDLKQLKNNNNYGNRKYNKRAIRKRDKFITNGK